MFKGIVLKGNLIKLEKWVDGEKTAECGIKDSESIWGSNLELIREYEKFVSEEGVPEYIFVDEYEGYVTDDVEVIAVE